MRSRVEYSGVWISTSRWLLERFSAGEISLCGVSPSQERPLQLSGAPTGARARGATLLPIALPKERGRERVISTIAEVKTQRQVHVRVGGGGGGA